MWSERWEEYAPGQFLLEGTNAQVNTWLNIRSLFGDIVGTCMRAWVCVRMHRYI
jgi:hypothetical protein